MGKKEAKWGDDREEKVKHRRWGRGQLHPGKTPRWARHRAIPISPVSLWPVSLDQAKERVPINELGDSWSHCHCLAVPTATGPEASLPVIKWTRTIVTVWYQQEPRW